MGKYYNLDELINMVGEPNKNSCNKIYIENKEIFEKAKGSKTKHQAWEGGYLDHITEVMNIGIKLYNELNKFRELPFSLSDSLLVLYLHDLEKPWKYSNNPTKKQELEKFENKEEFIESKIKEYGFKLTKEQWNGIKYIHGEGEKHNPDKRVQSPLAAFVNSCDNLSARIWYDYPKK